MGYRFRSAGSTAALPADVAALTRALPFGAVEGTESYLAVKTEETDHIAPFVPFLIAYMWMINLHVGCSSSPTSSAAPSYLDTGGSESSKASPGPGRGRLRRPVMVPAVAACAVGVT